MRHAFRASLVAGLLLVASAASMRAAPAADAADHADAADQMDGYIVVLRPGTDAAVWREHARTYATTPGQVYGHALRGYAARMSATAARRVALDAAVASVQRDGVVTIDAQTLPTGINRVDADLSPTARIGSGAARTDVDVAIIDTGIDLDHPDLNVHTAGAKDCTTGASADDGNGHGSHVAGTVGALDNGLGVVGVAPGARLWPVRVLDNNGGGTLSSLICGVDYVTAHASEIEVANLSLGGRGADDGSCGNTNNDALHQAICASVAAGVTYAVAAGNESDDAANHTPAAYDEVITVSAMADFDGRPGGRGSSTCRSDVDDTFASFSNFGADVDVVAPGVCILSTSKDGGFQTLSGTSMAAPHVAGGAALFKAAHPGASPAAVKAALQTAGTTDWTNTDDPDGSQEKLLRVATF